MSRSEAQSTALPHLAGLDSSAPTPTDIDNHSTRNTFRDHPCSPRRVAWLLLNAVLVAGLGACLPPDFEIDAAKNQPIQIDKSLLTINPDRFIDVSNCQNLTFDVSTAVSDPDGDEIQTVWLVNYEPGLGAPPDAVSFLRYTFRPCENPKFVAGVPLTLELFVLDRRPESFDDADLAKTIVDPETTTDSVVWFIGADALLCCPGGSP
jgi:hypothetical protein